MTEMQRRFSKSKVIQGALFGLLAENGLKTINSRRFFGKLFAEILEPLPEIQIKQFLLEALSCCDLAPEQRAELLAIWDTASTTLTEEQRRAFDEITGRG